MLQPESSEQSCPNCARRRTSAAEPTPVLRATFAAAGRMPTRQLKFREQSLRLNGRLSGSLARSTSAVSTIPGSSAVAHRRNTLADRRMTRISVLAESGLNIERHAYCLCLHVRPTTIFVALVNLFGSLICACLTLFFMVETSPRAKYIASQLARDEVNRVTGISVLMYLLLAMVSAMMLYGVIKSKPSYILPFFGIQFIDYLFTMPQFLASIYTQPYHSYYVNKAKDQLDDRAFGDMRHVWPPNSTSSTGQPPHFYTASLLFMTLLLIFKTYFLCVVWKCYRFLHMQEFILPLSLHSSRLADAMMTPIVITQGNAPPPNYEEATKMPDYKPPEYCAVVEGPEVAVNVPNGNEAAAAQASVREQTQTKQETV